MLFDYFLIINFAYENTELSGNKFSAIEQKEVLVKLMDFDGDKELWIHSELGGNTMTFGMEEARRLRDFFNSLDLRD